MVGGLYGKQAGPLKREPAEGGLGACLGAGRIVDAVHGRVLAEAADEFCGGGIDGRHSLLQVAGVVFKHLTVGVTKLFFEFGCKGFAELFGLRAGGVESCRTGQHIAVAAEVLGQAGDADVGKSERIFVDNG